MRPKTLAVAVLVVVAAGVGTTLILRLGGGESEVKPAQVTFDVLDAECGFKSVVTAQRSIPPEEGEFCLVRVDITNRGSQPVRLDPTCQFLISAAGERHGPRPDVLGADPASNQAFQAPIGPGQLVEDAGLYYDVPAGTEPATAEFHALCAGEPTRVDLSGGPIG
jgi:hypothetical protein